MQSSHRHFLARPQRWASPAAVGAALALMVPASAAGAAFTAHLTAPNHAPIINKKWPITVTATHGSAKLSGSVRYHFLFDGQVVSSQPGHSFTNGVYHDTLVFPGKALGHPITLQVVVSTRYGTVDLNWAVDARS